MTLGPKGEKMTDTNTRTPRTVTKTTAGGGAFLFLAFIGSLVYFWSRADSAGDKLLAVLQAVVWPAYLIYGALRTLLG